VRANYYHLYFTPTDPAMHASLTGLWRTVLYLPGKEKDGGVRFWKRRIIPEPMKKKFWLIR